MKTGNFFKFTVIAVSVVIFFIACKEKDNSDDDNYTINSLSADGSTGVKTTKLTFTVNDDKLALTADDIKINVNFSVIKGDLKKISTSTMTYELSVTPGGTGIIRVGLDPYRGFTGWNAKTANVYADWYFSGTSELTITGYYKLADSLEIPEEIAGKPVTAIGDNAFYKKQLTDVTIPDSVTVIKGGAFYGNELTSVVIPENITTIEYQTFSNNNLNDVTIPVNVTSIEYYAFEYNNLVSVTIPDSVTVIKNGAFSNNPLSSITIGENVTLGSSSFGNGFESVYNDNNKAAGTYTFNGNIWSKNP